MQQAEVSRVYTDERRKPGCVRGVAVDVLVTNLLLDLL